MTTILYVTVALSATATVPPGDLAASPAPLALVGGRVLGPAADTVLAWVALAATASTVLLLLVSASRSVYGLARAGMVPVRLARVSPRGVPGPATALVLGAVAVLVLIGSLEHVARATDAAVLGCFMLVNASLPWLAAHRRTPGGAAMRALDLLLPGLALVLCGWLFLHTGVVGWITAAALGALALVLARYRARPS